MVDLTIEGDRLRVEVRGWSRVWSLRRKLELPLSALREVYHHPTAVLGWWKGFRLPGTHLPGHIVAGTFYGDGGKAFWDVRRDGHAIVIELEGERYDRLVVDVEDPARAVAELRTMAEAHSGHASRGSGPQSRSGSGAR